MNWAGKEQIKKRLLFLYVCSKIECKYSMMIINFHNQIFIISKRNKFLFY